jgi:single-stranded-DNA-specific exonuclease
MFPLHDPIDDAVRAALASYDDLTAALLARRGVTTKEAAGAFLKPSYLDHLHDPLTMTDMEKAAERLARAIRGEEKIAVWSDYDADGIPGAVVLHDFLAKVGANFENHIPHRHLDGYGMNVGGVEKLARGGAKLLITVDSGITDLAPIARARELGVEVIVTDHHLAGDTLPDAFAVVDPNARPDEPYPFKGLCGAGVAWKLVVATLAVAPELREKVEPNGEKMLLDMIGLATIADMVPLVGENRALATFGLIVLRRSPRIGLQKLCRVIRVDQRTLSEDDIGFMVAPRVNAASRMGDAMDALRLLTTRDESEADALAKKLEAANRSRKAEAGAITRAVRARLKEREVHSVIAMGDPDWRPALLGLVAGTIADEYARPVFLWGREGNLTLKGSMRSGGTVHGVSLMQAAPDTFAQCGGHAAAGGFTLLDHAVFDLEDRLVKALATLPRIADDDLSARADAVIDMTEANEDLLKRLERLAPFGVDNPKPVFLLRDACVRRVAKFGKSEEHVKVTLADAVRTLDAVAFFASASLTRTLEPLALGGRAHLLAHLERDTFSRANPVRLHLLDIKAV